MSYTDFNEGFKIPFRNFILNDVEVNSLLGGRFYAQQLATFYSDSTSFPLAVFYTETGDFPNLNIIQRFSIVIRAYSNQSYDEAYWTYKPIFELLGGQSGPAYIIPRITVRPIGTATESFDEVARIFGVGGRFLVIWIP